MNQLLTLFRKDNGSQAMRQSAALTTVYLLELNHKFEAFMRDKVDRLESRVAAQQARQANRAASEAAWDDDVLDDVKTWPDEVELDETVPIEAVAGSGEVEPLYRPADDQTHEVAFLEPTSAPIEADIPDYTALLIGDTADVTAAEADEALPEVEEVEDTVENDGVWTDPISSKPPGLGTDDDPEWPEAEPEQIEDDIAQLIEDSTTESGAEPVDAPLDEDIRPGVEKLIRLTGDPRPDVVGIPASELLRDEPEAMIGWSREVDLSEVTSDHEAELIDQVNDDMPDDEALIGDDETAEWDAALPAAGQKGGWA